MELHATGESLRIVIDHESACGEARRAAARLARTAGLGEAAISKAALVATELGTNAWRHAGGGEILVQSIGAQVEVLAMDRGPGMTDVQRCMTDGYSTRGSAGEGLGAVQRASDEFDLYSAASKGAVVMARIGARTGPPFGALCVPVRGETACGDTWRLATGPEGVAACVVDGLGHGALAAEPAGLMADAFAEATSHEPKAVVERAHQRMSGTRGAAGACALLRTGGGLAYAGVGNISGHHIVEGNSRGLLSHSGILGVQARRVQQLEYESAPGALLVMHSDGLSARWSLADHPGLLARHPAVIAGLLFRDHGRLRDDATVLVVRQ